MIQLPLNLDPESLVGQEEASKFLRFSERALEKWRRVGGGPRFIKISARAVRYRRQDLIDWIAERQCSSTSEKK